MLCEGQNQASYIRVFLKIFIFIYVFGCTLSQWRHAELFSCTMWTVVAACGTESPNQALNLDSLHWEHGVLATGPPGKSLRQSPEATTSRHCQLLRLCGQSEKMHLTTTHSPEARRQSLRYGRGRRTTALFSFCYSWMACGFEQRQSTPW